MQPHAHAQRAVHTRRRRGDRWDGWRDDREVPARFAKQLHLPVPRTRAGECVVNAHACTGMLHPPPHESCVHFCVIRTPHALIDLISCTFSSATLKTSMARRWVGAGLFKAGGRKAVPDVRQGPAAVRPRARNAMQCRTSIVPCSIVQHIYTASYVLLRYQPPRTGKTTEVLGG